MLLTLWGLLDRLLGPGPAGTGRRFVRATTRLRSLVALPRLRNASAPPRLRTTSTPQEPDMPPPRLDTIDVSEVDVITFDYARLLEPGETLQSASVSAEVYRGTDASAVSMLVGSATVQPTRVLQRVTGRLPGVTYTLRCVAPTSASRTLTLAALLPCDRL